MANSLFQVYEYCRVQVLNAFRNDETADLSQAQAAIEGIRSAWVTIGPELNG